MNLKICLLNLFVLITIIACQSPAPKEVQKDQQTKVLSLNFDQSVSANLTPKDTLQFIANLIQQNFPDYQLFDYQTGYLNSDQYIDLATIAEKTCTEDQASASDESSCRKVILWLNTAKNTFNILDTNDQLVDCDDCGGAGVGDPHRGITIENRILSFESLYGSCFKTAQWISFKHDATEKNWMLDKIETSEYSCREETDGEIKTYITVKTKEDFGVVSFSDYRN